ncbi:hypothetical protein GCM10023190_18200 [Enteractinococcus fodinae]|uniref:AcrR family transcriptional regulator n=1 Tax=Enteractinococcus fodinae TaxID=684663 RepID=A0ABU2B479_9MICC|nr:TetR/AcrR family transcriptional regulator [Enteractinococcus fodinae]MDR7348419.1 AcrR family transcriptional regulator [Enteractinococcus fodinae]
MKSETSSSKGKSVPQFLPRVLATRKALLEGARRAFVEHGGFAQTSIDAIVARSQSSLGSLYNQYGSKAEIFLALYEDYHSKLWQVSHAAIQGSRDAGEPDPLRQYLEGLKAYLRECWEERDLTKLFYWGDTAPGFELLARDTLRLWIAENFDQLALDDKKNGELLAAAVTATVGAGARAICDSRTREEAATVADFYAELVTRLVMPTLEAERLN